MSAPAPLAARRSALPWLPAAIAVGVVVCFAPAAWHGFVTWDDELNFVLNPHYRGLSPAQLRWMFTTFHMGHYQPLSWVTLGLDFSLWGMHPSGYHVTNLVLHAANAALFYWIAVRLLRAALGSPGTPAPESARLRLAAAAAALLFAIHPLRVESVAWVSERRDVLSGFFYLAAVLAYLRLRSAAPVSRPRWLVLSVGALVLSLLAKAWGITLPVVLVVLDWYPLRRVGDRAALAAVAREKLPYAVPAAAAAVLAFVAQGRGAEMLDVGQYGVLSRLGQAAYGLCFYLAKTLLPLQLSPVYPLALDGDPTRPTYALHVLAVVAISALALAARARWPWLLASWITYALIVSPVLGLVQTGPQIAADRYTYLACLPWALLAAAALYRLGRGRERLAVAAALAATGVLAVLTVRQTRVWRDSTTLWDHALRLDADNVIAYVNRGTAYEAGGDLDRAWADYAAAIARNPRYADAYFGRANVRRVRGDLAGAWADFDLFVRLRPADPKGYANRGGVHHLQGDLAAAAADYRRALELAPWDWPFRGIVVANLGELGGGHTAP